MTSTLDAAQASGERSSAPTVQIVGADGRMTTANGPSSAALAGLFDKTTKAGGFLWLDFQDPDAVDLQPYANALGLHPLAVEDAATGGLQPKAQGFDDQFSIVFWSLGDAHGDDREVPKLFLFLGAGFVVTVRRHASDHAVNIAERLEAEPEYLRTGPVGALFVVLEAVTEHYLTVVNLLEHELIDLEQEVFDQSVIDDSDRIYRLRQRVGRLERPLSSLTRSISRSAGLLTQLGDQHPELAPYLSDAVDDLISVGELVKDQGKSLDTIVSSHENSVSQRQNGDTRKISSYGALLAVPTVIAGLFGMNFTNLPGVDWEFGWIAALAGIVILDAAIFINFKRLNWL